MLECKKSVVWKTDSHKMGKFIDEEFGVGFDDDYELNAMEEANNYCWIRFNVDDVVGEYETKSIDDMLQAKKYEPYNTGTILNYLCSKGKLEPREYMVDVSW